MQLSTFTYSTATGWSSPLAPAGRPGQTWVLAFGGTEVADDPQPWRDLALAYPDAVIAGCSTAGEMAGAQVNDATLSVAVAHFEHTHVAAAWAPVGGSAGSGAAGTRLAALLPHQGLRAVFVLSDGLHVNGTPFVAALARGLPAGVPISGGLAGDGRRFQRTWILADGQPQSRHVCAVGLYGDHLQVGMGCDGGWLDFGPQRRITRAEGNVLYELDHKPALDLYKTYLGKLADGLPGNALLFPLSIHKPGSAGKALVRTILGIDEKQRSMTFAGDMPVGHEARLMRSSGDGLISSTARAVDQAMKGLAGGGPPLVVSVSCVGRRWMLGERAEEEAETIVEGSPPGAAHLGFYSYGEVSPQGRGEACELHNQTMTVTVYAES